MMRTSLRAALLAIAGILSIAGHAVADTPKKIDIPVGDLSAALIEVSKQYGIDLFYRPEQVRGLKTGGAHGELTSEQAVARLIEGTSLKLSTDSTGAMVIGLPEAPTPQAASRPMHELNLAQADRPEAAATGDEQTSAQDPHSKAAADSLEDKLQEIVVTAQKREEHLKDVPISISVLSGAELDKSTAEGITEALSRVPGVSTAMGAQGSGTQVTVRGVTAGNANFQGSSPIAYYLDSAPFGFVKAAMAPDPSAYDLERVEVLRGPQGTLYGASALNGVVRVLTKDADLNKFEFKARTSVSSTENGGGNYRGDMAANVPLIEGKLGARAVLGYENMSGWIDKPNKNNVNDAERRTARLKLNAQPNEALSIGLTVWISRNDNGATNMADDNGRHAPLGDEPISTDYDVYGLKVGYDAGPFSITSMTSYVDYRNGGILDLAQGGLPITLFSGFDSTMFSEEVVLNSTGNGPWRWSLGGIYRDEDDRRYQTLPGLLPAPQDIGDASESSAIFGQLTRLFLDGRLELTGGLRYFTDRVTAKENQPLTGVPTQALHRETNNFNATTPRLVLTWHVSDRTTTYASYAEGFRSGFPQSPELLAVAPQFVPLEADTLKNYELGIKSSLLGGRVDYEIALFYVDWQDVQQALGVPIGGNVDQIALINGKSASGPGVDFALRAAPIDGLEFGVNLNWNDLTFDSPVYSSGFLFADRGQRISYSPEYTIGAFAGYAFPLGASGYTGRFSVSGNYTSEQMFRYDAGGGNIINTPGNNILIARTSVSVEAPTHWSATVYADNVNNENGAYVRQIYGFPDDWSSRPRPRTIGLQLDYRF